MFSKDIYKKYNGFIYQILIPMSLALFCLLLFILIYPKQLELGDVLPYVVGTLCMIGFISFPLFLALNKGMKNLYVKSQLKIENGKIIYIKQAEFEWTAVGHVDEKHYYTINKIDSYNISRRWIKIFGDIDKEAINNERSLGVKKMNSVKIARAFDNDSEIIKLLENQKNK